MDGQDRHEDAGDAGKLVRVIGSGQWLSVQALCTVLNLLFDVISPIYISLMKVNKQQNRVLIARHYHKSHLNL